MADFETFQLQDKLRSMPEYRRVQELDGLNLSVSIFEQNYLEMKSLLDRMTHPEVGMQITRQENRLLFERCIYELCRLLHNFVAASMSLVDHTRRLYRKLYEVQGLFPDYQGEIKTRFAENPLIQFVQDLRNYVLHVEVPRLAFVTSITDMKRETFLHQLVLRKQHLLASGFDWTKPATAYIDTVNGDSIDVVQVVDGYQAETESFYAWMARRLRAIHLREFEAVSKVQEEVLHRVAPQIPNLISQRLAYVERGVATVFDVLGNFLTPNQHTELSEFRGDLRSWTEAALIMISNYVSLPTELIERINRVVPSRPSKT